MLDNKFNKYSRLVHSISNKFAFNHNKRGMEEDITQEGYVGLIKAIKTYNPDKGTKFITYAYKCISNEIRKFLKVENRQPKTTDSMVLEFLFAPTYEYVDDQEEYRLTDEEARIVELKKSKYQNKEIMKIMGLNQLQIHKKINSLKKKLLK